MNVQLAAKGMRTVGSWRGTRLEKGFHCGSSDGERPLELSEIGGDPRWAKGRGAD